MSIDVQNIGKVFGNTQVLTDISLQIGTGEMVALLGPSGSGKTTLLRIIAGLEQQSEGQILFHGRDVSRVHARDRQVGFVFQNYALFRHMTVFDNVAFGLTVLPRAERPSKAVIQQKVMKLLDRVQLAHLAHRFPAQLSGGQKQRVALARALAVEPQILLLDEPFGALDAQVRKELRRWLRQLHEELQFTSVFVTHDQEEALEVADRIVVMSQGRVEQVGTPEVVWNDPASRFVVEFLGEVNQLQAEIQGQSLQLGQYHWPLSARPLHQGAVQIYLRPWEVMVSVQEEGQCTLPTVVQEVSPRGHYWLLTLQPVGWAETPITAVFQNRTPGILPQRGARYFIGVLNGRLYAEDQPIHSAPLALTA